MECFEKKITELRQIIDRQLKPLLSERVLIADAPFYDNIGDLLIWQGALDYLHENGHKLIGSYGARFFPLPDLDKDVTILMMGGGNFGDLWRPLQDNRLEIIARYPENRIVMLPQSICYQTPDLINHDAGLMARHSDLHLFARDRASHDILREHFSRNHVYLAPDMAFYVNSGLLGPYRNHEEGKTLFLLRNDKELPPSAPTALPEADVTSDWPVPERTKRLIRNLKRARRISRDFQSHGLRLRPIESAITFCGNRFIRNTMTRKGCEFLRPFSRIVTTRLHPMILSLLLHKPVEYIDNTYGKISAFAETWLHDFPPVKAYGRD